MTKKRKQANAKAKTAARTPGDYEVGYRKPPVHSRWGPNQSGNPGGRKKGQRNLKTMVLEVFEAEIEVTESGRPSKCTVAKALLLTLVQSGLKDRDIRAIARCLELYERFADKGEDKESEAPSEQDRDIIRRALHGDDPDGRRAGDAAEESDDLENVDVEADGELDDNEGETGDDLDDHSDQRDGS